MAQPWIAAASLAFWAGSAWAAQADAPQSHAFTAKVADVRLNADLLAQGRKHEDLVTVKAQAVLYAKPLEIADARKAAPHPVPEIDALIRYHRANIEGDAQAIAAFWLPEERAEKLRMIEQPRLFKANRDYHVKHPGLAVTGVLHQAKTRSVLLSRQGRVMGITFVQRDGQWFLTDRPSDDLELSIVEASISPR